MKIILLLTPRRWANRWSFLVIHNSLGGDARHIVVSCVWRIRLRRSSRRRGIITIASTLIKPGVSILRSFKCQNLGLDFWSLSLSVHCWFPIAVDYHGSGSDLRWCTFYVIVHGFSLDDSLISSDALSYKASFALLML